MGYYPPALGRESLWLPDFGAACDGVTDDHPAFAAALAALPSAGGTISLPPGTSQLASPLVITQSNVRIVGAGTGASVIRGANGLAAVVQQGDATHTVLNNALEKLTVSRSGGTPPGGSVGIYWANFNYASELDTYATNHDFARSIDGIGAGLSIGYRALRPYAANVTTSYYRISGAAGVFVRDPELGRNGGESYNPVSAIQITGQANDVTFYGGDYYLQGPVQNQGSLVSFVSYANTTGIVRFIGISAEDIANVVSSDAATPLITALEFDGCRIATGGNFFNLNAATALSGLQLLGGSFGGGGALNLGNVQWSRINGALVQALTATGTGSTCDLVVTGNTLGNTALAGTFGTLTVLGNNFLSGATFSNSASAAIHAVQGLSTLDFSETFTALNAGGTCTFGSAINPLNAAHFLNAGAADANYVQLIGASAGNSPAVNLLGSDTNVSGFIVAKGAGVLHLNSGGVDVQVNAGEVSATRFRTAGAGGTGPTWTGGTGAPAATLPVGSLYSRTDGGSGARLYVSAGGGTWNPVAGV